MKLAFAVGTVGAFIMCGLALYWVVSTAIVLVLATQSPGASTIDAVVKNYKAVSDEVMDPISKIFDLYITKTLLPIFTAILGYIFGSQRHAGDANS
jgi:hypothetical protein